MIDLEDYSIYNPYWPGGVERKPTGEIAIDTDKLIRNLVYKVNELELRLQELEVKNERYF